MLGWRLLVAAILIPALIGIFYLDAQDGVRARFLLALSTLLGVRCAWELAVLLRARAFAPNFLLVGFCTVAVIAAAWADKFEPAPLPRLSGVAALGPSMFVYALSVLVLFLNGAIRYREPGRNMETLAAELLIVSYVGVLIAVTVQLRWVAGAEAGYLVIGSLVIATKMGDVGAYTLGRLFGKRKMVPRLSPGKTWMGAWGAMLGSGLATWAWLHWGTPLFDPLWRPPAWYWAVLYGVILGIVGLIGDLCESLIKRDVERKDSGRLLPGFGGLLDLLDSILYAGPVAWLLWQVLPLGP